MSSKKNRRREEFLEKFKKSLVNEKEGLVSKKIESDTLAAAFDKYSKTYRPTVRIENPEDFSFYGSAREHYKRAVDYILNDHPFDGTREDLIKWHNKASTVDLALYKQAWPGALGSIKFENSQRVSFYCGPNKISEAEFVGKNRRNEPGVYIDPKIGSTIEFWLKKDSFDTSSYPQETIVHVGTYPGKLDNADSGNIKIFFASSSGSPFRINYKSGATSIENIQIGSANVSDSSVADSKWHHYAFKFWQADGNLYIKLYVDGKPDSVTKQSFASTIVLKNYLAGSLGSNIGDSSGTLSASMDEFRFWKGQRSSREIARFFDKGLFASDISSATYTSRLGLYYKFNAPSVNDSKTDSLVIDHSGHEIFGRIKNFTESTKLTTSAIVQSEATENVEAPSPILDRRHSDVLALVTRLEQIGTSYDANNQSMLHRFIPQWAREEMENSSSENPSEFEVLLHLLASEFDDIKLFLDSIAIDYVPNWQETNQITEQRQPASGSISINYSENIYLGCTDDGLPSYSTNGYRGDRYERQARSAGFLIGELFNRDYKLEDDVEGVQDFRRIEKIRQEMRHACEQRLAEAAAPLKKVKGTQQGIDMSKAVMGTDNDEITTMHLVPDEELPIEDKKVENHISSVPSVSFVDNNEATLYMHSEDSSSRSYIQSDSSEDSREYTFEGCFVFPTQDSYSFKNIESSLFGCKEVTGTNNDLTVSSPDDANFLVTVQKADLLSKKAKFVLKSTAFLSSNIETQFYNNVYDNSRWNISVRIKKNSSEPFLDMSNDSYDVCFYGYNYVQDFLVQSFEKTQTINGSDYLNFKNSHKSIFLGAERQNITGSVLTKADYKLINFSAWKEYLSDDEIKLKAQNPFINGYSLSHALER